MSPDAYSRAERPAPYPGGWAQGFFGLFARRSVRAIDDLRLEPGVDVTLLEEDPPAELDVREALAKEAIKRRRADAHVFGDLLLGKILGVHLCGG